MKVVKLSSGGQEEGPEAAHQDGRGQGLSRGRPAFYTVCNTEFAFTGTLKRKVLINKETLLDGSAQELVARVSQLPGGGGVASQAETALEYLQVLARPTGETYFIGLCFYYS